MALTGISSATASSYETTTNVVDAGFDNSEMSQDEFLKVLLADIQWQNPLEAKDVGEFINNSVKLREMEVLNSFENSVKALEGSNASTELLQASGLIGKTITYEGDSTVVQNGKGSAEFTLDSNADQVKVSLYDENGALIDSTLFSDLNGGVAYPFEVENAALPDGYYTVRVEATLDGQSVGSSVQSQAVVEGVTRKDGSLSAYFGDREVELDTITQIGA